MALNDLFSISSTRENVKYQINVQMVEIYNEQVRDLLVEDSSTTRYPFFWIIIYEEGSLDNIYFYNLDKWFLKKKMK